ncbi:hypothetical protein [Nocardia panacis]|uniref:hypothetical protein n=1 Tax=Nocardia panacis TaxID=2340916 RepID=UPI0013151223|nr:hypothetical protein [Nocardia panacis]
MAMRSCATVGEAVAVGMQWHLASGSLMDLEIERLDDVMALRMHERWPNRSC